jgi:tRNA A37 threonylcarbamoyladenosine biosynthesis protein TsaE
LVNQYESPGSIPVAHVDLYRLDPGDEADLDLQFYLDNGYLLIVEWAEKIIDRPAKDTWIINLYSLNVGEAWSPESDHDRRKITMTAIGKKASGNLKQYLETIKKGSFYR